MSLRLLSSDMDGAWRCHKPVSLWKCRLNTFRQRQNGRHFADDIFKWIFFNEKVWISIKISLKFVPQDPINNIPALDQIMAWRRPSDKPLSGPMMVTLPTHICVTRPQWVKMKATPPFTISWRACDSVPLGKVPTWSIANRFPHDSNSNGIYTHWNFAKNSKLYSWRVLWLLPSVIDYSTRVLTKYSHQKTYVGRQNVLQCSTMTIIKLEPLDNHSF